MDLFENLQNQTGAYYLSDIHYMPLWEKAIECSQKIDNDQYAQSEWIDLLNYLTKNEVSKALEIEQIKLALANALADTKQIRNQNITAWHISKTKKHRYHHRKRGPGSRFPRHIYYEKGRFFSLFCIVGEKRIAKKTSLKGIKSIWRN